MADITVTASAKFYATVLGKRECVGEISGSAILPHGSTGEEIALARDGLIMEGKKRAENMKIYTGIDMPTVIPEPLTDADFNIVLQGVD